MVASTRASVEPAVTDRMTGGGASVTIPSIGEVMMMTWPLTTPWELVTLQWLGSRNQDGRPISPRPMMIRRIRPGDDRRAAGAGRAADPEYTRTAESGSARPIGWAVATPLSCCFVLATDITLDRFPLPGPMRRS